MKKILLILIAVVALEAIFSCSRENEAEDVRSQMDDVRDGDSRSAARNDSTEKGGITLNTEWGPDSTVNF